jgi:hypothetical protein
MNLRTERFPQPTVMWMPVVIEDHFLVHLFHSHG